MKSWLRGFSTHAFLTHTRAHSLAVNNMHIIKLVILILSPKFIPAYLRQHHRCRALKNKRCNIHIYINLYIYTYIHTYGRRALMNNIPNGFSKSVKQFESTIARPPLSLKNSWSHIHINLYDFQYQLAGPLLLSDRTLSYVRCEYQRGLIDTCLTCWVLYIHSDNRALVNASLPTSLLFIGQFAFAYCSKLTTIVVPTWDNLPYL
jgi:hypothetical protein